MFGVEFTNQLGIVCKQEVINSVCNPIDTDLILKVEPPSSTEENEDENVGVSIPFTAPYKIRDPSIMLERCDKLWETFKIIKDIEITKSTDKSTNVAASKVENPNSYVKYEPMLINNDNVPSYFKLIVKNRIPLFHCLVCGKQYKNNRDLNRHTYTEHPNYMPIENKQTSKEKTIMTNGKECNNVMTNISNLEIPARNCKENPKTKALQPALECVSTSPTNNVTKQHVSMQLRNRRVSDVNKSVENDQQDKISSKEVEPQAICLLCKQSVTNMKDHLIIYHKIESPNLVLKNVTAAYPNDSINKKRRASSPCISHDKKCKLDINNKRRRKTFEASKTIQCATCLGNYKKSSYYKHIRLHRQRDETLKNYRKKLKKKYKLNSSSTLPKSRNKSVESNEDNSGLDISGKVEKLKMKNNIKDEKIIRRSESKIQQSMQTNADKTSSIGVKALSATKKNDATCKVIERSDDTLKSFNYSQDHSCVIIKSVEDNIEVDIEDIDSQNDFYDNTFDVASKVIQEDTEDIRRHADTKKMPIKTEVSHKKYEKNQNSETSGRELRSRNRITPKEETYNIDLFKKHVCSCGKQFYTQKAFDIHMKKEHSSPSLTCGYCKEHFPSNEAWHLHKCTVRSGEKFVDLMMELTCSYCNTIHKTPKIFDEHVRANHFQHALPYLCFKCSKRFPTEADRKDHWYKNHNQTMLCSICKMEYTLQDKCKHRAYHSGLGIPCHICKKTYANMYLYINHMNRQVKLHKIVLNKS